MTATTTRAGEIGDLLCREILTGQYRSGERLPSERELATRFGTNRGAVREALKKLEQLGVASIRPGGVRVVPIEEATLDVLGPMMALDSMPDPVLVNQMFEVASALMAMSVKHAVTKATESQINTVREMIADISASAADVAEYRRKWRTLGEYFNEVNGNLVLRLIGNGLKAQFMGHLEAIGAHIELDRELSLRILGDLDQAISARDAEQAATSAKAHFDMVRGKINEILDALSQQQPATGTR